MIVEGEEVWAFPLSSWAYYQKLRQMEWIVQLGVELHIYRANEMAGMYWLVIDLSLEELVNNDTIGSLGTSST